jgi:hypothetical protein
MKKLMIGVAVAALLGATPAAIAKDKASKSLKSQGMEQSSSEENANRLQNEDGTFQGKPVVQGPAKWNDLNASASSGASTGEGGASGSARDRDMK